MNAPILTTRDGTELKVRRLASGDGPALRGFNESLSETSRRLFLPHAYDDETIARYIERSQAGDDLIYLLWSADEVVGYFFLWEFNHPVPLLGIGLADAWQGRGLGRKMMDWLIEEARAAGKDAIELTTMPHNEKAFELYQKVGFQYVRDVDNVTGDGATFTERMMFLPLKEGSLPTNREFKPPV